jgi:aspartate/methionine/tyrosine aminotransferase
LYSPLNLQRLKNKMSEAHSPSQWISERSRQFDSSGIRKVFELAAKLKDPVNLSIGQPDFDVPEPVKAACIQAIQDGKNAYSMTQGIAPLREKLSARIASRYGHDDRKLFISSGTSGGLVLAMLSLIDPGDEVLIFDPYFVMYPSLVKMAGGTPVFINTYPDFRIDLSQVEQAITKKTKLILFNSPANPTGVTPSSDETRALAQLAHDRGLALISDEIYSEFVYEGQLYCPADDNPDTIVIDGFSKSHAMTGWRVGWVHGPSAVIETMIKMQQFSFVCAPQPAQWASLAAMEIDISPHRVDYTRKRDILTNGLRGYYEFTQPGGAFYLFPKAPSGFSGSQFVAKAIENNLLIIPGNVFSQQDTHFRISYAAPDETLHRGVEILRKLAS